MQSISVLAVLALAFSCTLALDVTLNQHWKLWKEANNKRYNDAEEHLRYEILLFLKNLIRFYFILKLLVVLSGKLT